MFGANSFTPRFTRNSLTAETLQHGSTACRKDWRLFVTGVEFAIKDITVQTFPVPHDAVDPVGFVLHHGAEALGFLTDLGCATKLVFERVRAAQTLVIETNHDEKLLQDCKKRPWSVKQRIMSRHGHLSNAAAGGVIAELLAARLHRAVLGHLSLDCNSPDLAAEAIRARAEGAGLEVFCAGQREISPRFAGGDRCRRDPGPRERFCDLAGVERFGLRTGVKVNLRAAVRHALNQALSAFVVIRPVSRNPKYLVGKTDAARLQTRPRVRAERGENMTQSAARTRLPHEPGKFESVLAGDRQRQAEDRRVQVQMRVAIPVGRGKSQVTKPGELPGDFCGERRLDRSSEEVTQASFGRRWLELARGVR